MGSSPSNAGPCHSIFRKSRRQGTCAELQCRNCCSANRIDSTTIPASRASRRAVPSPECSVSAEFHQRAWHVQTSGENAPDILMKGSLRLKCDRRNPKHHENHLEASKCHRCIRAGRVQPWWVHRYMKSCRVVHYGQAAFVQITAHGKNGHTVSRELS